MAKIKMPYKLMLGDFMKKKNGFTLLELLVVVLIIGILAAIALPRYKKAVARSEMAGIIQNFKTIQTAMEEYYLRHNIWPNDMDMLDIEMPSNSDWVYSLNQSTGIEDTWQGQPRAFASIKAWSRKRGGLGGVFYSISSRVNQTTYKSGTVFCCLWTDDTDKRLREFCENAAEPDSNVGSCYTGGRVSVKGL